MNKLRVVGAACVLAAHAFGQAPKLAQRLQEIGVTTSVAGYRDVQDPVTAVATAAQDEATETTVEARFAGWIEQVFVNTRYQRVHTGEPLFTIYSPDLYAAEQEYVQARRTHDQLTASPVAGVAAGAAGLLDSARARLEQEQVPAEEAVRLEQGGEARQGFTITAPAAGIVTERDVLPNLRVEPGMRLYTIAALSPLWINAQVNEPDLGRIRIGQTATVAMDAYPGRIFHAQVDFIVPRMEEASRTGAVRLVLANDDQALLPGMYGSATIAVALGRQLVIPASGVLETGGAAMAFVDHGSGQLEPRRVEVGAQVGDEIVIRKGLRAGERVVTSANFLVASEAQLQAAAGSFAPPPAGVGATAAPADQLSLTTEPTPARKGRNRFRVRLAGPSGAPIAGAQLTLTLYMPAMPAMGMAEMKVAVLLTDQGGGYYEGSGELKSGGSWQTTILAVKDGHTIARQQSTLQAEGGM